MTKTAKKNKRGARGSTEEESSVAKKPNMAELVEESGGDNEEESTVPSEESEETEASLLEIKHLLLGVQKTLHTMQSENRKMSDELKELRASFDSQGRQISQLKQSLAKANKANEELQEQLKKQNKKIQDQESQISEILYQNDQIEQYTRKNSIEIHGIPEELYTSTNEVVTKLAQKLNVPISTEDIDISHKLYNGKDKPKSIIVKLISHQKKTELYKKRVQLKNVKVSDLFPNSSAAAITQSERLFINENATRYRKHLMKKANQRRKDEMLHSVWSMDGKIFVKTSLDGVPIRIFSEQDLENL